MNDPVPLTGDLESVLLQVTTLTARTTALIVSLTDEASLLQKLIADLKAPKPLEFSKRFGPTWAEMNPTGVDTRPTLFSTPDQPATMLDANGNKMTFLRCDPYNVGFENGDLNDYWSCSGQVAYVPDTGAIVTFPKTWDDKVNTTTMPNPGLDRVATFAHYNGVFATSPRLDYASIPCRPDGAFAYETRYAGAGRVLGMVRNSASLSNEALGISENGFLMAFGTQTSRDGSAYPLPVLQLPATKKVTGGIATTTGNELALITVIDTETARGQLAVVALEAKWLSFHTWPYMGLTNQGSWSDFKLLGFLDLSIASPMGVAAASNMFWDSPGQTNGQSPGQVLLSNPNTRAGILNGEYGWTRTVATKGYAVVSSKSENKVVIVDLTPVFAYLRQSWLVDYDATFAARGPLPTDFPKAFTENPTGLPKEIFTIAASKPTCVLAGLKIDRWSKDVQKAYIATESGKVYILDASSLMARYDFEQVRPFGIIGNFTVGRNPVAACFARFIGSALPLIPTGTNADAANNLVWFACRGDRRIDQVVTFKGDAKIVRSVQDARLDDPVGLGVADRGNILSVADFSGRKIHSFRIGGLTTHKGKTYGAGKGGAEDLEYCGALELPGYPFAINSANVN